MTTSSSQTLPKPREIAEKKWPGKALMQRYALLLVLFALIAVFSILLPNTFFRLNNLTTILGTQSALVILALGVTLVLLVGEFDLSVASIMGMVATTIAWLTTNTQLSPIIACLIALVAALLIGLINAFFVVRLRINSFIVTLGMSTLVTGIAVGIFGSTTIGGLPDPFTLVFQTQIAGIQLSFFYTLIVVLILFAVIGFMPLGRKMFFTGNAQKAATLAGIDTSKIRTGAFVGSAALAAFAGMMLCGQTAAASPTIANSFLLPAYAAAFLGSTAFTSGRFNIWGTFWAVYFLATGTTGLQFLGLQSWVINVFEGAVLILAVAFSEFFARKGQL